MTKTNETDPPQTPVTVLLDRETLRDMGLQRRGDEHERIRVMLERIGRQLIVQLSTDASFLSGGAPEPLICDIGNTGPEQLLRATARSIGGSAQQLAGALRHLAQELDPCPDITPSPQGREWRLVIEAEDDGSHHPGRWPQGLAAELLRLMATISEPDTLADRLPYRIMEMTITYLAPEEQTPEGSHVITGLPDRLRQQLQAELNRNRP